VLTYSGTIFHQVQMNEMVKFFAWSETRSIIFKDFAGDEYEVLITEFQPVRQRTVRNPRDPSIPYHYWTYSLKMEVLAFRNGPWAAAGVNP
jgi:hypothetical protein